MKLALLIAAAALCGCAAAKGAGRAPWVSAAALQTSDRWREWYSDHLTLDSDVDEATASTLLRDFEHSVVAFDALLLPDVERPRARLRVVLFARARDFRELEPSDHDGIFLARSRTANRTPPST